jgi:DNA-binding IclR family transcriptional regulator
MSVVSGQVPPSEDQSLGDLPVRQRGRKPEHGEPVLEKAMRLLTAFENGSREMTLAELCETAGLAKSTGLRFARQLTGWGLLERLGNGKYVIGLRMLEIASLAPRGHGLRNIALPFMQDLHRITGQHVLLAVRIDLEAVLIERLSAHRSTSVKYRVGGRLPLTATGVGLVLAAHASASEQQHLIEAAPDANGLRRTLAQIRATGVASSPPSSSGSLLTVAAPVFAGTHAVVAALSVVGTPDSLGSAHQLALPVQNVAQALSRVYEKSIMTRGRYRSRPSADPASSDR